MKLLAIETATEACSCALRIGGRTRVRRSFAPRRHAQLVLPMVSELLAEAGLTLRELDGIAFGRGPGAFTGVRIAAAVAQGLAFGAGLPVAGVSSLQALAQGARRELDAIRVLAAIDARMQEVYFAAFEWDAGAGMQPLGPEQVGTPARVARPPRRGAWTACGSGWAAHGEALRARLELTPAATFAERYPDAADVAALAAGCFARGEGVAPGQALPVYLRDRVTAAERSQGTAEDDSETGSRK